MRNKTSPCRAQAVSRWNSNPRRAKAMAGQPLPPTHLLQVSPGGSALLLGISPASEEKLWQHKTRFLGWLR